MKRVVFAVLVMIALSISACQRNGSAAPRFTEKDLYLNINGAQYRINMNMEEVTAQLGTDYDYAEAKSCDYDGLDKTFIYEIVEFYTYPMPEGDLINEIYSESPSVSTSKGISVGATKEDVLDSYGGSCEDTGDRLTYKLTDTSGEGGTGALCFDIEEDAVRAISITVRPL